MRRGQLGRCLMIALQLGGSGAANDTASGSANFVLGAVCAGTATRTAPISMLRGRHLRIGEVDYPPFASKDPTAPYGWRGYDIDLISSLGAQLGFTYEIFEIPVGTNETWGAILMRVHDQFDLVLNVCRRTASDLLPPRARCALRPRARR